MLTSRVAGGAAPASVTARHWPPGYFYRYQKLPVPEKEKLLARIDAALENLKEESGGLIAKGAVIEKPDPGIKTYPKLTILDESGLIIMARQVPNLYYRYRGPGPLNPNIFIVVKNAKVNKTESFIRQNFVVEGDFQAYADKFVKAIMQGLENAEKDEGPKR
ncbi:MAG: hypothetical protein FJ134_07365 [Deltaproteobacteria bacterium]|nr:hypothetical protein [Deltaproteobacteria bacterium]